MRDGTAGLALDVLAFLDGQVRVPHAHHAVRYPQRIVAVVMAGLTLVHCSMPAAQAAETAAPPQPAAAKTADAATGALPTHVGEMREQILAAVRSGRIEDLQNAIEWNELPPEFGDEAGSDPITHWKTSTPAGDGRTILAVIEKLFALAPAQLPIGADPENNVVYVWPYLAEKPLDSLTPAERADLLGLMPEAEANLMIEKKKWAWWRLSIGADGTWLTFMKHP